MKTFPTLYKRTKTGAIQQWTVSVIMDGHFATIVKNAGQLYGKLTQHQERIIEGKNVGRSNETHPQQQALMQAQSDWKKKHDEGYKSFEDLGVGRQKGGVHHGLFTIYNQVQVPAKSLEEILQMVLPKFNTDASGNVKPMLATDWTKVKSITYPCYIQPKLDGVRCLMIVENTDVIFLSRSGKEYTTLDHIRLDVKQFLIRYENSIPKYQKFILDGEIYSHELTFQEITAAVKKERPESLKLHFRAYDVVSEEIQQYRIKQVSQLVDAIESPFVHIVDHCIIYQPTDVKFHHDKWVQEGYEGAMLRLFDGMYAQGQRSRHLLKVKEFDETEFAFHSFEHGQRLEDLIAVCLTDNQKPFRAKMQGSKEQKQQLEDAYKAGNLEGLMLTVKHFGWTDDGLPRFPIGKAFREDLS